MTKLYKHLLALVLFGLLAGCGGGGGGGAVPAVPSSLTFPFKSVILGLVANPRSESYTIGGTLNGAAITGSGTSTFGRLTSGTFEGSPALAKSSSVSMSLSDGSTTVPISLTGTLYYDSNYEFLGSSVTGSYEVVTTRNAIPETVELNDNGILWESVDYSDNTKASVDENKQVSFTTLADTATSILVRIIETGTDSNGSLASSNVTTYRLDSNGNLTALNGTLVDIGSRINFTRTFN